MIFYFKAMIVNTNDNNKKINSCGKYGSRGERFMFLRNILNIIFMLGALIGMVIYFKVDHQIGTIVILSSMLFKIVECVFRFIK